MLILALDTSGSMASCALLRDGALLDQAVQDSKMDHSRLLLPLCKELVEKHQLSLQDVDVYAAVIGPGSFTGIRIGIAAAKGLAFGADKPAIGVSTLAAMAGNVAFCDGLVICAMDARRQQIYNALFEAKDGALTRLTEDRAIALSDLLEEIKDDPRPKTVLGDGGILCRNYLTEHGVACRLAPPHLVMQNAMSVALEAERLAQEGKLLSAQELEPVYLRPPHADLPNRK